MRGGSSPTSLLFIHVSAGAHNSGWAAPPVQAHCMGSMTTMCGCAVAHCTRVSGQGGKWGRKSSSPPIPQTYNVHLEMRDLFPIQGKALPRLQVSSTTITHRGPHGPAVPHTDPGPLWTPTRRLCCLPSTEQEGRGWDQGFRLISLQQDRLVGPPQSLLDPGLSLLLSSHLHSPPIPILSIQLYTPPLDPLLELWLLFAPLLERGSICLFPCPSTPPRKWAKPGDVWRHCSSWVTGERLDQDSCSLSFPQGCPSWRRYIRS